MDVYLPDGDGLDVVQQLMDRQRHPDVIVITAARDMSHGSHGHAARRRPLPGQTIRFRSAQRTAGRLPAAAPAHRRAAEDADQAEVDELFGILARTGAAVSRPDERALGADTRTGPRRRQAPRPAPFGRRGGGEHRHQSRHRAALPQLSRTLRRRPAATALRRNGPTRAPLHARLNDRQSASCSLCRYQACLGIMCGMKSDFLRGHLEGLLLAVLDEAPGHGYALTQRLAARSGGDLAVPEGSLYPALQRLERRGLVSSSWVISDGRRRRIYRLAAAGRRELCVAARDWKLFSAAVDRVLGGLA